ncbi:group II truncated hemoglobin [Phenylobacterium soli]|uniref:Globin n=1 Tax=Phenylobacterium soli TaxID=2170551 RepID=A0A328AAD9_9CAUL|nr:group II truncated hemoglobin [Phenylobacterium soli]RAK51642.1 globin [Phenylobacterium soli]
MSQAADTAPKPITPYQALGEEVGVRALAEAFYDAMEREPSLAALRAMHGADLTPMKARLADFLIGWTGGPPVYSARHPGRPCVMSAHAPFPIGAEAASQWLACMKIALDEVGAEPALRKLLEPAFERMCQGLRSR